jgi:hypothetical protein
VHQEGNDTAEAVSRRPLTAKPVFVPRASNEGCGVDEVVMEQVLLRVFWPSPVIIIPPLLYYVSWGINNRPVCGHSSTGTQSRPTVTTIMHINSPPKSQFSVLRWLTTDGWLNYFMNLCNCFQILIHSLPPQAALCDCSVVLITWEVLKRMSMPAPHVMVFLTSLPMNSSY